MVECSKENLEGLCSSFNQSFPPDVSFNQDDIGNFIYGSAAYSMGLSIDKALVGCGAFGIWNGSKKRIMQTLSDYLMNLQILL